jgi:hypothetical protein
MTDYSELVKRMRQLAFLSHQLNDGAMIWHPLYTEAADALEAQAKEIEELKNLLMEALERAGDD